MANFRFTIDIGAQYTEVTQARTAVQQLTGDLQRVRSGQTDLNVNSTDVKLAEVYLQALNNAIQKVEREGGDLGTVLAAEFQRLRTEANLTEEQIEELNRDLERSEDAARRASSGLNALSRSAKIATQNIRATSGQLDRLKNNMQEGFGQTLAFGTIGAIGAAVTSAFSEVLKLDEAMTNVSIVSGKSREEMEAYRDAAGEAANALGTTARDYLEASLIYEQQGGKAAQYAQELAKSTIIAANITGDSMGQMSEYITATMNGFDMLATHGDQAGTHIADVLSNLGAVSGSGLDEMAEALQRTATVAKNAGYDFEDISSAIATVSEATRRSPQVVGTAFKSILLSFQQLREGSEEDLTAFSSKVEKAFQLGGIADQMSIFDDNGRLREARDIMEDLGKNWGNMTKEARAVVSESIAGKEQAETLQSFLDNQGRYNELLGTAYDSAGVAARQQLIYMDSLEAKVGQLKNAWQGAADAIVDTDFFKGMIDQATKLLDIIGAQESAFAALGTALLPIVGIFGQLFGARFVADAQQAKNAKNFSKNVADRLEQEGRLTDELREQLEIGDEQQRIVRALGEHSGQVYKQSQEQAKALKDELIEAERVYENLDAAAERANVDLTTGNNPEGVNSKRVQDAGNAAKNQVLSQHNAEFEAALANTQRLQSELAFINATDIDIDMSDPNAELDAARIKATNLRDALANSGIPAEQLTETFAEIDGILADQDSDLTDINGIYESMVQDLEEILDLQRQIADASVDGDVAAQAEAARTEARLEELRNQLSQNTRDPDEIRQEADLANATAAELEDAAARSQKWQKITQVASGAFTALTPIVAGYKSVLEGAITQGEFMQTSLQSISASLLLVPHPAAKVAGGIGMLIATFVDFRSEAEKTKEMNEDIQRSYISLSETTTQGVNSVRGMKDAYKDLQESGATAEQILSEGSDEAKEAYLELAESVATSSPELVKYFDAEGNAVLDLSKDYDQLLASKLEEARATEEILANNSSAFIAQYSGEMVNAVNDRTEANNQLKKSQEALEEAQEFGDAEGIQEALKSIQEYTTQLSDSNAKTKETRDAIQANIINPITGASEAITKLTAAGDEGSIKAANALKRMSDSMLDDEWIATLSARGQTDDIENMTSTVSNLVEEIGMLEPAKVEESVAAIEKIFSEDPAAFAFALQQANGSLGEFKNLINDISNGNEATSGFLQMSKEAQVFGGVYQEQMEKISEANREIETDTIKTTALVGGSTAAVVGYAMSAGSALAPVTGGLSLVAGTAISVGAAVVGAAGSLITYSSELEENYEHLEQNAKLQIEQYDALEAVADAYEQTSKTVEGYNTNLKNLNKTQGSLDGMEKMLESLSSVNPFTKEATDSYNEFARNNPDLAIVDSIKEGENALTALQDSYDAVQAHQSRAIAGMMMNNTEFYDQWLKTNTDSVTWLSENYGVDARNFETLGEIKTALEAKHAWEFANYEAGKFQSAHEGLQQHVNANYQGVSNIGSYWAQGTNAWLNNLNFFSSESLSISDKVKIGFFMVVDGFTGMVEGVVNTVLMTWNTVVNGIYDGIEGVLKKLGPLADAYEFFTGESMLTGVDKGRDMFTAEMTDFSTNLASGYGNSAIARNEANKRAAINDVVYGANLPAFEAFDGFNKSASDVGIKNYENAVANRNKNNQEELGSKGEKTADDKDKEKDVEDLELELDRYYKLDNIMSKIEDRLETLGRLKDQAYGQNKINLMAKEQAQYAAQEKTLRAYVKALQAEQTEQRNLLKRQGFNFDSGGEITNLNQRLTALQNAANKKTGEAKEKAIENVEKLQEEAARYSEITFDLLPDKKQAIEEAKATVKELEREKLEYKVELRIEKSDMLTQIRDVMKELNGEEFTKLDENMLIVGDQLKANIDLMKYYQDRMNEVSRNQTLTDADRQEMLNEYKSSMIDAVGEAKSAYEELGEIQLDFISQTSEMISEVGEGFDRISEKAANLAEAYKKAYGKDSYDEVARLRDIQLKTLDAQALAASKARDEMFVYRDSLQKGTEAWKEATAIIDDLGDQIQESLIEKIDLLKDKFKEFMDTVLVNAEKEVFGALGLDAYEETLNRVYDDQDKMLNTFDKITQIGMVIAEVNQAIAKSTDPAQAERYAKFRDQELQTLMNADKVSKAQLERAQLVWDIEQKQNALEQRKNASRMAQLIRDENGNMSYEYVAKPDDAKTETAEKDLAQAENNVYEFDREQAKIAQQDILNIMKEADAKIAAYYADETLSDAERKSAIESARKQAINDLAKAQEEMVLWTGHAVADGIDSLKGMFQLGDISFAPLGVDDDSVQKIFDALDAGTITVADMMNGTVGEFANKIGLTADEANKVVSTIIGATGNEITSMTQQLTQVSNEWIGNFNSKLTMLNDAYTKTQRDIRKTTDALAGSTGNLNTQINENTNKARINTEAIKNQAAQMVASKKVTDDGSTSFKNLTTTLVGRDGGSGTYGAMIKLRDEMNKKLQGAIKETDRRSEILSRTAGKDGTTKSLNLMAGGANYAFKMSKQFDSGTITTANANIKNMASRAKDASNNIEDMGNKAVISRANIAGLSTALAALPGLNNNKKHYYTVTNKDGSIQSVSYKDKPKSAPGSYVGYFDTGGYTGEWTGSSGNQEGRPAIVHEKEIILNKDDTVNFLKGIEIQRSMLKAVGGMENLASSFTRAGTGGSGMEQSVSIYAEFPNATNSSEIQDALSSLSLQAASHAFNKKN